MMAALIAEFVGTFALVFVGAGAIVGNGAALGPLGIALAHGFTIATMASATGHVSGGHLNPAVTIGFVVAGRMPVSRGLAYIGSQVVAAVLAAMLLNAVFTPDTVAAARLGTPLLGPSITPGAGVALEAVLTFFLVFVIFGTAVDARAARVGGLYIGLAVTLDILVGGPLTGAAMNPARSLGPALVGGYLADWWVYWVGPILGAIAAALVYDRLIAPTADR